MKTILVTDDDDAIRSVLSRTLTHSGYRVLEASSGAQAEKVMSQQLPDLVVTDIIMPDVDGLEFIFQLRDRIFGIPIVAISGGGRMVGKYYLDMARRGGAAATFEKPLDLKIFVETIDSLLARKSG